MLLGLFFVMPTAVSRIDYVVTPPSTDVTDYGIFESGYPAIISSLGAVIRTVTATVFNLFQYLVTSNTCVAIRN